MTTPASVASRKKALRRLAVELTDLADTAPAFPSEWEFEAQGVLQSAVRAAITAYEQTAT